MDVGTLTIYSASAGSGKTHKLAGIYLEKLFQSPLNYRKILAVTFTHKATAEMKGRILDELNKLAVGENSKFLPDIIRSSGKKEETIRSEAKRILYSILHDYSRFCVSTIDSFYQKIIRAFVRDIGLHSGFNIELDHTDLLKTSIDRMIDSAASDLSVRDWLTMFAKAKIEEGKNWDLKKSILGLAGELFSEKYKILPKNDKERLLDKEFLKSYISEMRSISSYFVRDLKEIGIKCIKIFDQYSLADELFFQKGRGVPGFIKSISKGIITEPNKYVREIAGDSPRWSSGKISQSLSIAIQSGLDEGVKEAIQYYDQNILFYKTSREILSNIYILGILSDILKQVRAIANDENIFLLSDAGELIYLITQNDQAPFIYERVGNAFENFMIDEFQDTSIIQWKNFAQLIENSMAQGFDNLIVGDIKQSIYRWRNSDWRVLHELRRRIDDKRYLSKSLETNWRSCTNIIKFNNTFFSVIPYQIDNEVSGNEASSFFREVFSEAGQIDPGEKEDGYVRIEFVDDSDDSGWQEIVLKRLPLVIESLQDKGYKASDIGILVRDNKEGALILKEIINYSLSCPGEKRNQYNYNIVSSESLLLVNSPVINFITAVLQVIFNPENMIARAVMLRYYLIVTGTDNPENITLKSDDLIETSTDYFPKDYNIFLTNIRSLPLWNIIEKTIDFFNLGKLSQNVAFLDSFQDLVLAFTSTKNLGIGSFLDWWESEGIKKSILLPEQQDSMRVLTLHKSKGLEFRVVITPFLSWNLDHNPHHNNIIWVIPDSYPFNQLGIVPVRYKADLEKTIFASQYTDEKTSAYLDNLNLLYVAFTRAVNVLIGFAPSQPRPESKIASIIRNAVTFTGDIPGGSEIFLYKYFNQETRVFEYGRIPVMQGESLKTTCHKVEDYPVNESQTTLKIKLHWEDYLTGTRSEKLEKINYGKLMHEIFSEILTLDDIRDAVRKKVIEGKISLVEEASLNEKIISAVSRPEVMEWFEKGSEILNETSILMPDSFTKRPDRIILKNGKAIIVDFKFGNEDSRYLYQIRYYKEILAEMGYNDTKAYLWYFDSGKVVSV